MQPVSKPADIKDYIGAMDGQKHNIVPPIQLTAPTTGPPRMDTPIDMFIALLDNDPEPLPSTAPGSCHPAVPSPDGDVEGVPSAPGGPQFVSDRSSDYSEIMNRASSIGYSNYSIAEFCKVLRQSRKALNAFISSVELYAETVGVNHRYVILHVERTNKRTLYIRLDRRRDHKESIINFALRFSTSAASDGAWVSGDVENLHLYAKKRERTLSFGKPVPFPVMAPLLEIVESKSTSYHLTDENCWFFASIIQEILALNFAGGFQDGKTLKHSDWAPKCRVAVKKECYAACEISDQTPVAANNIIKLCNTMRDPDLQTISRKVIDDLLRQHRNLYESPFHQAKDHLQLSATIKKVFRKLSLLSEGSCGIDGSVSASKLATGLETCRERRKSTSRNSFLSRSGDDLLLPFHEEVDKFLDSQLNTLDYTQPAESGESDQKHPSEHATLLMLEALLQCERANQLPRSWRFRTNEDIGLGLQSEFEKILPERVLSACLDWCNILCQRNPTDKILQVLMTVLESCLPQWMSVMGVFGKAADIYQGLWKVRQWIIDARLRRHPSFKLLDDACREVIGRVHTLALSSLSILSPSPPWVAVADSLRTPTGSGVLWKFVAKMTYSPDEWSPLIATVIHPHCVRSVAFSPTCSHLVSGTDDEAVRVWPVTEEPFVRYSGPTPGINSVGFSPKGDTMAAAFDNGVIQAWDVATGEPRLSVKAHDDEVRSVAFSRSGSYLASASDDETIRIWNVEDGSCSRKLRGHAGSVRSVSFDADDTHVFSASEDGTIRIWRAETGELAQELETDGPSTGVQSMAYFAERSLLASAHDDGRIYIWNVKDGKMKFRIPAHAACVTSVIFSPDGEVLASASDDRSVRLWDTFDGTHLLTIQGHGGEVTSVAFSSDGEKLVSSSADRTVRVWDVVIRRHLVTHKGHTSEVLGIKFSENGTRTATISSDSVCVWQTMSGVCVLGFEGHFPNPNSLAFSPNGTSLASVMADESIRVWDAVGGAHRLTLQGPILPVTSMLFSPKGTLLASFSENASFSIWDIVSGELKATLKGDTVAFSSDDKYVASISRDAIVRLWDTEQWQGRQLNLPEQVRVDITSLGRSQDEHQSEAMLINVSDTSMGVTITSISHPSREAPMSNSSHSVHVEENRVYVVRDGRKMTLCWLPEYLRPGVLAQYRDYAFMGGKNGEVLFVNVEEINFPED